MRVSNGNLILRTRNPEKIQQYLPELETLRTDGDIHTCQLDWRHPHKVRTAQILTALRMKNVPEVMDDYDWPTGQYAPFPHQRVTSDWCVKNRRGYILSTMGLGKTGSLLHSIRYLLRSKAIDFAIVVAPLSILKAAWEQDKNKMTPDLKTGIVHGSKKKRLEVLQTPLDMYIVNYDGLHIVQEAVSKMTQSKTVAWVLDESTAVKNSQTRRFKSLKKLIRERDYVYCVTGSPVANSPMDCHGQALLVREGSVCRSAMKFKTQVMYQVNRFIWREKPDASDTVFKIMQPSIRFSKEDVLPDLPPVTFSDRYCELTAQQRKYYKKMQRDFIVELEDSDQVITSSHAAARITKLLQIAAGSVYDTEKETIHLDCAPRIQVLEEIIQEAIKVVCFVPFRHSIEQLRTYFSENYGPTYCQVLQGGVTLKQRSAIVEAFLTPEDPQLLLCQPQTASHGLSLVSADYAVWFSPGNSSETFLQANNRLDRPKANDERRAISIIKISATELERKIYGRLESKVSAQQSLLDMYSDLLESPV